MVVEIGFCGTWDLQKRKRSIRNAALVFVYEIRLKTDFAIIWEFYKLSIDILVCGYPTRINRVRG